MPLKNSIQFEATYTDSLESHGKSFTLNAGGGNYTALQSLFASYTGTVATTDQLVLGRCPQGAVFHDVKSTSGGAGKLYFLEETSAGQLPSSDTGKIEIGASGNLPKRMSEADQRKRGFLLWQPAANTTGGSVNVNAYFTQ